MAALVQACMEADFDAATGVCAAPVWMVQSDLLPLLSIADAQAIGYQIALLLAGAWVFRVLIRFVKESN